jgi:signal peptide peptidase SppA
MTLEADLLIDRRRLKRRLALWRAAAVVLLAAGAGLLLWDRAGEEGGGLSLPGRGQVGRLAVEGFIGDDRERIEAIDRLARDSSTRALIVAIDSPGGSVAGGEALHAALGRFQARKPVVAVMRGTAASAGYMAALPADRIFAREATVTGSIGVLLQSPDASGLLDRLGLRVESIASGALKDQPSPFHPLSPEGREALARVVADMHDQFVGMVARARRMEEGAVRAIADGRVFTGRQALAAGLVDAIGGEREARGWLAAEKGVPDTLPVRDLDTRGAAERLFGAALRGLAKSLVSEWVGVDGFRLLWQPAR